MGFTKHELSFNAPFPYRPVFSQTERKEAELQDEQLAKLSLPEVLRASSRIHVHPLSRFQSNPFLPSEEDRLKAREREEERERRRERDQQLIDRRCDAFNEQNPLAELWQLHEDWRPSISRERARKLAQASKMPYRYTDYLAGELKDL